MFKEIEEKIKEEKYQSAEEQLDKLIINEKILTIFINTRYY